MLPLRQSTKQVEIVDALGEIGPAAAPAIPSLQSLLPDANRIVQIHAANALLRIQPGSHEALDMLRKTLADDNAAHRWRAADGLRQVGPGGKSATEVLRRLLKSDDVRVRVTAAGALWAIESEVETVLPVLIQAMKEPDEALSTKFTFPSYAGESHRVYVAGILAEMGPRAGAAVPVLVAAIKEMAIDFKKVEPYKIGVGMVAMRALGKIGPAARSALPAIREVQRALEKSDDGAVLLCRASRPEQVRAVPAGIFVVPVRIEEPELRGLVPAYRDELESRTRYTGPHEQLA